MINIRVIRAVGTEFLARKFRAITIGFVIAAVLGVGLVILLVNVSSWFWLVAVPLILLILLGTVMLVIAQLLMHVLKPQLTAEQRTMTIDFVDKLERVAESIQTPPFVIFFYVLKDTVRPKEKSFLRTIIRDSASLKSDYQELQKLF